MAFVLKDRVRESSTTTGTGAIALAGAAGGYQAFSAAMSIGDTCWYSIVLPGSAWETGIGTYSALNTLTRTSVLESSNAGSAVVFAAGTKDVFICQPASKAQPFPSGTLMLFQQTSAPIYWTKQATHNDKALRVVSGAASSGGTNAFSTVNGATAAFVNGHQLTTAEIPSHTHGVTTVNGAIVLTAAGGSEGFAAGGSGHVGISAGLTIDAAGGAGSHSHTLNMAIQYVDVILAMKD
jgi:hypothetical protein